MFKDLYLFMKDIYQNRKLLLQFSINDFKSRYAGSFFRNLMGVYQSAIYCIDLLAGIWCWTESTNDRCKIPIYRIFSYRDDSLVLLLRCICINYGCFSGIYLFSKESRIQYSYLAHDENPIQSVHPFILHSDWHSCRAYKWYISFSNVFTADLLFILHVCFLDRIDLADGIDPTIFT